ncbi:MAG: molecular chaperone TorD family protein, partial [Betaproteobacteria bacterium]|nr:molecular chaperone TorD family protein [Betaproteobacteria bacterium]
MSTIQAMSFSEPRLIAAEDQARADFYALLAHLFYRAPDARLLQAMAVLPGIADDASDELATHWRALAAAAALMPEEALVEEYQALFIGVGRPPVMLYGSFYVAGFMMEKP